MQDSSYGNEMGYPGQDNLLLKGCVFGTTSKNAVCDFFTAETVEGENAEANKQHKKPQKESLKTTERP